MSYMRIAALLAAVILAMALVACGDGNEKVAPTGTAAIAATPTATTPATPRPGAGGISDEDLASMVPTKADLGQDFTAFQETSNLDTNEGRVESADNPADEEKDQQTFRRVSGYDRQLAAPSTAKAETPLYVQIGVTLFENSDGASGYLHDNVKDIEALVDSTDPGLSLEAVDQFQVPLLGDESLGLRSRVPVPEEQGGPTTLYVTYFWFRRDRVLGDVALARLDDTDVSQQAETIASLMEERIAQVLSRVSPSPTVTP